MNQVKKCFTLSGPVFTWLPDPEEGALDALPAPVVEVSGYDHLLRSSQHDDSTIEKGTHSYNTRFRNTRRLSL